MTEDKLKNEEQENDQAASSKEEIDHTMVEEVKAAIESGDFDIGEFLTQYKSALCEKEEAECRAMRVQADFDNFRKRSRKDNDEAGVRANSELICMLLPVIDSFEREGVTFEEDEIFNYQSIRSSDDEPKYDYGSTYRGRQKRRY